MKIIEQANLAKKASFLLASAPTDLKDKALRNVVQAIDKHRQEILEENKKDLDEARINNVKQALVKRLILTSEKIDRIIDSIGDVIRLQDPVGKKLWARELDESLILSNVTVPIGVIGMIFESRPDALVQISSLCIKSGNVVILKGGSEAYHSNRVLFDLIKGAVEAADPVFKNTLHLAETRQDISDLLKLDKLIDLMIPRGSNQLVRTIKENTKIPVLGHADGICHLFIDRGADLDMALRLTRDAKCQYPAVCNAIETLLVHRDIAGAFLPKMAEDLKEVELKGDERTLEIIEAKKAVNDDWSAEYNDLILSVKVVDSLQEAISHINNYGSHHTDAIVTGDSKAAETFIDLVDSSSVMWNCSTRFSDGFRYGLGAEVGVSTNKIHARGPVGLEGLTITKFKLIGKGHTVADYVEGKRHFTHRDLQ